MGEYTQNAIVELRAITKNTGLPDLAKENNREVMKDVGLRKFFSMVSNNLSGNLRTGNVISTMMKRAGNAVREKFNDPFKEIASGIGMVMDMQGQDMDMQKEFASMDGGAELDDKSRMEAMLAKMLGENAGKFALKTAAAKAMMKFMQIPGMNNTMKRIGMGNEMFGRKLNSFMRDGLQYGGDNWFLKQVASIVNSGREFLDLDRGIGDRSGGSIEYHTSKNLYERTEFNNYTQKSITEIIPGYLARILQSTEALRTGEMPDLVLFSHERDKFIDAKSNTRDVVRRIFGNDSQNLRSSLSDVTSQLETDSNKFTDKERRKLEDNTSRT